MMNPYNYSSKFIERCERFKGSVDRLLIRLERNEYAEIDPAFKDRVKRLTKMKEEIASGKFSKDEEEGMFAAFKKEVEEIYGKRFDPNAKVLGKKALLPAKAVTDDFLKEEKAKRLSQARGEIYDFPEVTNDYIADELGMFKGIGMDSYGVFDSNNHHKLITDDGQLAYVEGEEPEQIDMKKEHEEAWGNNQWLYGLGGLIRESQKFMLPLEGDIGFCLSNYDGMKPLVRSPYRNIVLEYPTQMMFETTPITTINKEVTGKGIHGGSMILVDEHVYDEGTEKEEIFWSMIPIAYNKTRASWWCEKIIYQLTLSEGGDIDSFANLRYYFVDMAPSGSGSSAGGFNVKDINCDVLDETRKEYLEHMGTLCAERFINFAIACNTKNIKKTTIYPSKKLNAKRIAKGKLPLFEYKVLDIHREAIELNKPMSSVGTGSKKRQHMCKGHFKKRKTGVYWWNPQVRGSKELGVVKKDYKIIA